jgi:hypothetical protein
MNSRSISQLLFLTATLMTTGCTRSDNSGGAGKGGSATLSIIAQHHTVTKNITTCKMYIKYNAQDVPAYYDDSIQCNVSDSEAVGIFSGLKTGNYYIYGFGYDSSVKQNVKGGMPYTISAETNQTVNLAVTE